MGSGGCEPRIEVVGVTGVGPGVGRSDVIQDLKLL